MERSLRGTRDLRDTIEGDTGADLRLGYSATLDEGLCGVHVNWIDACPASPLGRLLCCHLNHSRHDEGTCTGTEIDLLYDLLACLLLVDGVWSRELSHFLHERCKSSFA